MQLPRQDVRLAEDHLTISEPNLKVVFALAGTEGSDERVPSLGLPRVILTSVSSHNELRFACDAMCGGLARWLRTIGYDTTYVADVADAALVEHARREGRVLISADGRLFERRAITSGEVRALRLPRGLKLRRQLEWVVLAMRLDIGPPRCTACNGTLSPVRRDEVQHIVPARSLVWADEFYRCQSCGKTFWNGTHWMRMQQERERLGKLLRDTGPAHDGKGEVERET